MDTPDYEPQKQPKLVSRARNDRVLIGQEAQLTQRDRASILSVKIVSSAAQLVFD